MHHLYTSHTLINCLLCSKHLLGVRSTIKSKNSKVIIREIFFTYKKISNVAVQNNKYIVSFSNSTVGIGRKKRSPSRRTFLQELELQLGLEGHWFNLGEEQG